MPKTSSASSSQILDTSSSQIFTNIFPSQKIPPQTALGRLCDPGIRSGPTQPTVFSTYLINTIVLTIGTGLLSTLIGVFSAWAIACCEFPLKKFFEWALILPLAIPTYVSAYAYFDILELSNPILIWVRENINLESMQSLKIGRAHV